MGLDSTTTSLFLFLATGIGAALAGGWHCAGMCGPIAALATSRRATFLYQLGRLIAYALLGSLAGALGEKAFGWIPENRRWIVSLVFALFSLWVLMSVWRLDFANKLQKYLWAHRPRRSPTLDFLSLGLLNGFLPCSWLYGFLVVGAGTGRPLTSAFLMICLWLGALPWLLFFSFLGHNIKRFSKPSVWVERFLFVAIVLGLIAQHFHVH